MRTTGLGFSAVLVAVGAILAWAVTDTLRGVDLHAVGIILFVVGLVLAAITLAAGAMGRRTVIRTDREAVVDGRPVAERHREVARESAIDNGAL